jgi:hypothetical protein
MQLSSRTFGHFKYVIILLSKQGPLSLVPLLTTANYLLIERLTWKIQSASTPVASKAHPLTVVLHVNSSEAGANTIQFSTLRVCKATNLETAVIQFMVQCE